MSAQSGIYVNEPKNTDGTIVKWTITLNVDGTFLYHFLRDLSAISKPNKEENFYGKGTWVLEGKSVIFFSSESDKIDETYSVNLNNSKARYITKSPRDKTDKVVETALHFYESYQVKGLKVTKID
jgi:hypothetical protein